MANDAFAKTSRVTTGGCFASPYRATSVKALVRAAQLQKTGERRGEFSVRWRLAGLSKRHFAKRRLGMKVCTSRANSALATEIPECSGPTKSREKRTIHPPHRLDQSIRSRPSERRRAA